MMTRDVTVRYRRGPRCISHLLPKIWRNTFLPSTLLGLTSMGHQPLQLQLTRRRQVGPNMQGSCGRATYIKAGISNGAPMRLSILHRTTTPPIHT